MTNPACPLLATHARARPPTRHVGTTLRYAFDFPANNKLCSWGKVAAMSTFVRRRRWIRTAGAADIEWGRMSSGPGEVAAPS